MSNNNKDFEIDDHHDLRNISNNMLEECSNFVEQYPGITDSQMKIYDDSTLENASNSELNSFSSDIQENQGLTDSQIYFLTFHQYSLVSNYSLVNSDTSGEQEDSVENNFNPNETENMHNIELTLFCCCYN